MKYIIIIFVTYILVACGAGNSSNGTTKHKQHIFIAADLNPLINDDTSYIREYGIYNHSLDGVLIRAVHYINGYDSIGYGYGDFAYLSCMKYLDENKYCSSFAVNATNELDQFKLNFKG